MDDLLEGFFLLTIGFGPMVGFWLATRQPGRTRGQILRAAVLGGAVPGLLLVTVLALRTPHAAGNLWPFLAQSAAWGAFVGVGGLLARDFGGWLRRRP